MDLLDFEGQGLYFDEPISERVNALLNQAADSYGETQAEFMLFEAYFLAPSNLTVLVALYRYFYYQHRLDDALIVSDRALLASGNMLGFPPQWQELKINHLGFGAMKSMGLVRFYLLCLKAAGYLNLRLGNDEQGIRMLKKVMELDESDRLGAGALLDVVKAALHDEAGDGKRLAVL
jgi:hypothetical protein